MLIRMLQWKLNNLSIVQPTNVTDKYSLGRFWKYVCPTFQFPVHPDSPKIDGAAIV